MKYFQIEKIQERLAYLVTVGIFVIDTLCIVSIADDTIAESVKVVLGMMLGSLNTGWLMIITFYYGSSFGSIAKSKVILEEKVDSLRPLGLAGMAEEHRRRELRENNQEK